MDNVTIYAEHREILDALITSGKVKSLGAALKTGPFKAQREAYVFAASLGLALGKPRSLDSMPTSKKDATTIRDSVFLGAEGASELSLALVLIDHDSERTLEVEIEKSLDLLAESNLQERFSLMDRYAYAGFQWLAERHPDESSVRDLILTALEEISAADIEPIDDTEIRDPLLQVLLE